MIEAAPTPLISVVVLNFNGARWIECCLNSLDRQTIRAQLEIIVADNQSADLSDVTAERILRNWSNGQFVQHGNNLGFAEGNNRAAVRARGRYLFFLNNDTWLEPDCLEVLIEEVVRQQASAATPQVLNYSDDSFQSLGAAGFDLFGLPSTRESHPAPRKVFMPEGCSFLIKREIFHRLGGFDATYFMFAEEYDLSWRLWLAGHRAVAVPAARLHHRGAADANPAGGAAVVEFRTSYTKRFLSNRNGLLTVLKNAEVAMVAMVPLQLGLLFAEALVGLLIVRRWSFVKRAYWEAVADCWRLRGHIVQERRRMRQIRRRSDWWLLRYFLRWRLNRWDEVRRVRRMGLPRITPDGER